MVLVQSALLYPASGDWFERTVRKVYYYLNAVTTSPRGKRVFGGNVLMVERTNLLVLTINLRREDETDGLNHWRFRKERTALSITNETPHIFGTQEGRQPQISGLSDSLENYTLCDQHRRWDQNRSYPCIFYRPDCMKILESDDLWLSQTPHIHASKSWGSAFPRLATWARCVLKNSKTEFIFVSTHFDHISSRARTGQAGVLLQLLEDINPQKDPVIMVGDFNDLPGSKSHQILTSHFNDAFQIRYPGGPEISTWHGFTGTGQRGRIDWILVSPDITVLSLNIIQDKYAGAYPSDHFPVRASLRL